MKNTKFPPWVAPAGKILMFAGPTLVFILLIVFFRPQAHSTFSVIDALPDATPTPTVTPAPTFTPSSHTIDFFTPFADHDHQMSFCLLSPGLNTEFTEDVIFAGWSGRMRVQILPFGGESVIDSTQPAS
jgi:hypothetical protein